MTKEKTVNYTDSMVETMRAQYEAAENENERGAVVDSIAASFGKSRRSIVSKMSREGFYIAKKVVSKVTGEAATKKDVLAAQLSEVSGVDLVSAEKLNKTDLRDLIAAFKALQSESETES